MKDGHAGLFIQLGRYNEGVMMNEYKGEISLVMANEGSDGRYWMKFAFPQDKDREPRKPAVPMGVKLGTPQQAIGIMKQFIEALTFKNGNKQQNKNNDDDIPF